MNRQLFKILLLAICAVSLPAHKPARAQGKSKIENPRAIAPFIRQLREIKEGRRSRPALIIQYGDSHTAADLWTSFTKNNFQRDFGNAEDGAGGVKLYYLGVNGMRAEQLKKWSSLTYSHNVTDYAPDLIILSYGSNEVIDSSKRWTLESYTQMFGAIIRKFKQAAPNASVLVIGPPDRLVKDEGRWTPAPRMSDLIKAQRRAAFDAGASFWEAREAMGGPGSMAKWISQGLGQSDAVHLTSQGYLKLALILYADFKAVYEQLKERPVITLESPSRTVGRSIRFRKTN